MMDVGTQGTRARAKEEMLAAVLYVFACREYLRVVSVSFFYVSFNVVHTLRVGYVICEVYTIAFTLSGTRVLILLFILQRKQSNIVSTLVLICVCEDYQQKVAVIRMQYKR